MEREAAAPQSPPAIGSDWYEAEQPLGQLGAASVKRLVRRAAAAWPRWVVPAIVLGLGVGLFQANRRVLYEARIVLRVSEGALRDKATLLTLGDLRDQIDNLTFSNEHLVEVMKKFNIDTGSGSVSSPEAVADFRALLNVSLAESDLVEDEETNPRRSAHITLEFHSRDPERAWKVAHELANLVVGAGLERQRRIFADDVKAATESAHAAARELTAAEQESKGTWDRIKPARVQLSKAQQGQAEAEVSARALASHQSLRFEIVDPGRVPTRVPPTEVFLTELGTTSLLLLVLGALLVGAFDRRVLTADDVASVGLELLGRFPALARRPPRRAAQSMGGEGEPEDPRV